METKKIDYVLTALGAVLLVAGLALALSISEPQGIMKALPFVSMGIGCGMLGRGISIIVSQNIMEKNPEIKKQKQIEEQDERNVLLSTTAAAKAYKMATYVFDVLLLSYALMGVELLPILMLVAGYLFVIGYGVWCRVKLEKKL